MDHGKDVYCEKPMCHTLFDMIGDAVHTGPTLTNVNDVRAILIA